MNHKELYNMLENFEGTTIVRIHAITEQSGEFHAGIDGSRKKADKMITNIGVDPKDIKKEQWASFLLTSCTYSQLVQNMVAGHLDKELAELGVELTPEDKRNLKAGLTEYETSERKNGKTINSYLAESAKDQMGMITVYRNIKGNAKSRFFIGDEEIDKTDSSSRFAPYFKDKKTSAPKKQVAYAKENGVNLRKFLVTNNFRFDSIVDIKINGVEHKIES
jgi:hypothetical protein